jgi:hypothetical protein
MIDRITECVMSSFYEWFDFDWLQIWIADARRLRNEVRNRLGLSPPRMERCHEACQVRSQSIKQHRHDTPWLMHNSEGCAKVRSLL